MLMNERIGIRFECHRGKAEFGVCVFVFSLPENWAHSKEQPAS